jgi:hypothetical protein
MKAILLVLSLITANAFAAGEKDTKKPMDPKMEAWMKAAAPGEEHKTLAQLAGKWKYVSKMWEAPTATPHESTGINTNKMILGGRYLEQEMNGKTMGMKFQGKGTLGYDNVRKVFESTWIDNMGTGLTKAEGTWDPTTKTITDKGTMADPTSPGGTRPFRSVTKIADKNSYVFEMFTSGDDGKEFKMMEITYKRN